MSEYKRQHYLPAVYLQQFSVDQAELTRRARVWRFDGSASRLVPVASQCFDKHFYSQRRAKEVEGLFGDTEGIYGHLIKKIRRHQDSNTGEYFQLILLMCDLHLRNASYENATSGEGFDAYVLRVGAFKQVLLSLNRDDPAPTDEQVIAELKAHWRVRVLEAGPGYGFITSDHPSVWIASDGADESLQMIALPMTPLFIAIAYNRRLISVKGNIATDSDQVILNRIQCRNALQAVYSAKEFDERSKQQIAEEFQRRSSVTPRTTDAWIELELLRTHAIKELSFVKSVSPSI